jgi:X-Pro dipeptidyl-peptidase
MRTHRWAGLVVLVALAGVAGCLGEEDALEDASTPDAAGGEVQLGADAIDEDELTEPVYDVLPKQVHYVDAPVEGEDVDEGVELYVEVHLPDGEGPWPTILESSPYHVLRGNGKLDDVVGPTRLVDEYVPRGYAVVLAHVRGTGNSEGCMDMMGDKEQADQAHLVEWITEQKFSDGKVGMHGVSYVGTTPHEAAIHDPEGLETIVTTAGVTNQWRNTFMNGVPYDGRHYPLTYELLVGAPPPFDVQRGEDWAANAASGACGQREALEHMSPGTYEKGIYDEYWAERNLTRGADNVTASVLYNQGFDDRAVNPSEAIYWFNELDVPTKGLFHQAGHQYPPREDYFTIEHAWLDHWLKGIDNGVMDTPQVAVQTNTETIRTGDTWPPENASQLRFNLSEDGLVDGPVAEGSETYLADMARNGADAGHGSVDGTPLEDPYENPGRAAGLPSRLTWTSPPVGEDVHLAGPATLHLNASVDAENTYFVFDLFGVGPQGEERWLAEGWFNAHLREGFDRSAPLTPGETYAFTFDFEPREWRLEEGHRLKLQVLGHDDRVFPIDEPATRNTITYGPAGSWLEIPVLEEPSLHEPPAAG